MGLFGRVWCECLFLQGFILCHTNFPFSQSCSSIALSDTDSIFSPFVFFSMFANVAWLQFPTANEITRDGA